MGNFFFCRGHGPPKPLCGSAPGNFELVKSWQKNPRPIGASVLFVLFWSHSKPHTKAQLKRPKRLAQSDNQLLGEKHTEFCNNNKVHDLECMWELDSLSFSLEHTHITYWEATLLGHKWNWSEDWKCSKELLIFGFEIHHTKVHSLIPKFWNLLSTCYQLRMK